LILPSYQNGIIPTATELEVDILREEVTVPFAARVTVPGLKLQVPKGKKPLLMQVRNTLPANPFTEVTVTVELAPVQEQRWPKNWISSS